MLKLLSWRRSAHQTLTLSSNVSFHLTHPPILSISRFLSQSQFQSQFEDPYDPPFSPTSKTLKINNETTKKKRNHNKKKNKKKKSQEEASSDSKNSQTFPLKSDLPFDFKYSYSETNSSVEPVGFREPPRFSPFGPGRLDRKWTGTCAPAEGDYDSEKVAGERNEVLGEPLSEEEVAELVERYRHSDCSRQINLGTLSLSLYIYIYICIYICMYLRVCV